MNFWDRKNQWEKEFSELPYQTAQWQSCLGRDCHFLHEKENLYSNGLILPQQEAGEIQRMYFWWVVGAVPLLWDTVWLKGKTLHSLVLVGTPVVFSCHFHPGFEAWCLIGTVEHILQCSGEKWGTAMMVMRAEVAWWQAFCFQVVFHSSMTQTQLGILHWIYLEACLRGHADFIKHKGALMRNYINGR